MNRPVMEEMKTMMDAVQADPAVKAAVLVSGKPGNFIAGALCVYLNLVFSKASGRNRQWYVSW